MSVTPSAAPPVPVTRSLGPLAALSVVLIWASWLISTRHSVGGTLTPLDLSLLRYGLPAIVLAPFWLKIGLWPKGVSKPLLAAMVVGSGAPFFQVAAYGMQSTPASAAGVLLPGTMPLATALIGIAFFGERPDRMRKLGMVAILCGGLMLLIDGLGDGGLGWRSFVILPFGATLWAIYTHAFRQSGLSPFAGGGLIAAWSTILNLAALPFVGSGFAETALPELGLQLVTQGLLSGLAATLLYGIAVRALGGTQAAAYTAITPVAAAIGGAYLPGEGLGVLTMTAAVLTGLGVLLSTGLLSRRPDAMKKARPV